MIEMINKITMTSIFWFSLSFIFYMYYIFKIKKWCLKKIKNLIVIIIIIIIYRSIFMFIVMLTFIVGEDLFQACKQFVRFGAEGLTRLCSFKWHEQFLRLTPTSKKYASHSCLISLSSRQECTTCSENSSSRIF